jgi:hypothetical protein
MDPASLVEHLALADTHIEEGERRIEQLRKRIAVMERSGRHTPKSRDLLRALQQTQALHIAHRDRLRKEVYSTPRRSAYAKSPFTNVEAGHSR